MPQKALKIVENPEKSRAPTPESMLQGKNRKETYAESWPGLSEKKNLDLLMAEEKMDLLGSRILTNSLMKRYPHFDLLAPQNYFLAYMFMLKLNLNKRLMVIIIKYRPACTHTTQDFMKTKENCFKC